MSGSIFGGAGHLCEDEIFGYVNIPRTRAAFLEHVHAGVGLAGLLSLEAHYAERCREFVLACQNRDGGFSRATHGSIATLENTWLTVETLHLLNGLSTDFMTFPAS